MSDDTLVLETPGAAARLASRKFLLTLMVAVLVTVAFALGRMSVDLWAGCLLAVHLVYVCGNVGGTLASGIASSITAVLSRGSR